MRTADTQRAPIWPLIAIVFTSQVAFWAAFETPGRTARLIVLGFVPALLALSGGLQWRPCRRTRVVAGVVGVSVLLAVVSWGVSGFAWLDGHATWIFVSLMVVIWWAYLNGGERFDEGLARGAVAALLFVTPFALYEAWVGPSLFGSVHPPAGAYMNRNVAAQAMVLLTPLAAAGMIVSSATLWRWLSGIASCLGMALIMATRSRGALIAVVIAYLAVAAILVWRSRGLSDTPPRLASGLALLVGVAVVAALIPVGGAQPLPSMGQAVGLLAENEPAQGVRLALWGNSAAMIGKAPLLGVGLGQFGANYPLVHDAVRETPRFGLEHRPNHAHNDLLQIAAEQGAVVAVLAVVMVFGAVFFSWKEIRRATTSRDLAMTCGLLAALVGASLHAGVSFPWQSPGSALLLALVIGRCWVSSRAETVSATPLLLRSVIGVGVLGVGLIWAAPLARSQSALGEAFPALIDRDCSTVRSLAREAAGSATSRRDLALAAMLNYECDQDAASSLQLLDAALEAEPHHVNVLLAAAARRIEAGRLDDAESALRHTLEILPDQGRAWLGLVMVALRRGDPAAIDQACEGARTHAADLEVTRQLCPSR